MRQSKSINELMRSYEVALSEYGLGYITQLRMLERASRLGFMHEQRGLKHLNDDVIAEYFQTLDELFYNGKCNKINTQLTYRMVERFLHFVDTGEIKLSNPLGARNCYDTQKKNRKNCSISRR